MNFIIEQQAQFSVDMQVLKERQADGQKQIDEIRGMIRHLVDVSMSLVRHAEETDLRLARLGEETDRRLKETGQLIRELRDGQAHTDRRLDALIDTVDKLIRGDGSKPALP
jgi:predicted  nucleic acid-binding Zn-ribbon protein